MTEAHFKYLFICQSHVLRDLKSLRRLHILRQAKPIDYRIQQSSLPPIRKPPFWRYLIPYLSKNSGHMLPNTFHVLQKDF